MAKYFVDAYKLRAGKEQGLVRCQEDLSAQVVEP